jgi:hypothetical protein
LPLPRQLAEIPTPIEDLGRLVDAVEDDCNDRKGWACHVTIRERLREQAAPETFSPMTLIHAEPGQDRHREVPAGQASNELRRQVRKIDLGGCERVEPGDVVVCRDQCLRRRQALVLVLQRFGREPVVELRLTAAKGRPRVGFLERSRR